MNFLTKLFKVATIGDRA